MIHHASVEVSDLERSGRFYDAVFGPLGWRRQVETDEVIGWGIVKPVFFASTRRALAIVEAATHVRLQLREVREGRLFSLVSGKIVRKRRFRPDRSYRDAGHLPPVRAPYEAVSCLTQLAELAAA